MDLSLLNFRLQKYEYFFDTQNFRAFFSPNT